MKKSLVKMFREALMNAGFAEDAKMGVIYNDPRGKRWAKGAKYPERRLKLEYAPAPHDELKTLNKEVKKMFGKKLISCGYWPAEGFGPDGYVVRVRS